MIKKLLKIFNPKKQPPAKPLPPANREEESATLRYMRKQLPTLNDTENTLHGSTR